MEPVFHSIGVSRLRIGVDGEGVTTLAAGYGCACAKKIHARYGSAESTDPGQDPYQTGKQAEGSGRFPESRQMELWDLIKG